MLALTDKYNENVRIWLGHRLLIVLANPEDVKVSEEKSVYLCVN